ncbi:CBS domain-containing protein [Methanohalophilus halophilus]|uniref:CBS domain-containing protein n=2 Tax=Methanohalophilus halophilus TaxID=2177 RepID=A0A1H2R564_9EURY|nr:CBS domain-containing protein [Methanohalophilus halophilus]RNI08443.1 CBS domain-containing protein [Methanohalophilus halophilus]SDW14491.1 mannose-1-phosphate guanylyltransferase / mannose-6-phosphate isomerase [Methanohalophilus halophilus]
MKLYPYVIYPTQKIKFALEKIDKNKQGFLIVIDNSKKVIGTLSDGDIRRGFLKGTKIDDYVDSVKFSDFEYIYITSSFKEITQKFKSGKITFLPILDSSYKLINIITKKQFHLLLMEDMIYDLNSDFFSLDVTKLDHEIYNRPWGYYKTTFLNEQTRAKIIKVLPKGELSLQEHKKREEHWVIIKGCGEVIIGDSVKNVYPGDYVFVPKGCKHKISNKLSDDTLLVSEVQLGDYFGEDDIIRYKDIYGRI